MTGFAPDGRSGVRSLYVRGSDLRRDQRARRLPSPKAQYLAVEDLEAATRSAWAVLVRESGIREGRGLHEGTAPRSATAGRRRDRIDPAEGPERGDFGFVARSGRNHIDPDPAKRSTQNQYAMKDDGACGQARGCRYGGPGTIKGAPLAQQVDEIVRGYTGKYFPLCEKYKVR